MDWGGHGDRWQCALALLHVRVLAALHELGIEKDGLSTHLGSDMALGYCGTIGDTDTSRGIGVRGWE